MLGCHGLPWAAWSSLRCATTCAVKWCTELSCAVLLPARRCDALLLTCALLCCNMCCAALHTAPIPALRCAVLRCTVLSCVVLRCAALCHYLCCVALRCAALRCATVYATTCATTCAALHCPAQHNAVRCKTTLQYYMRWLRSSALCYSTTRVALPSLSWHCHRFPSRRFALLPFASLVSLRVAPTTCTALRCAAL